MPHPLPLPQPLGTPQIGPSLLKTRILCLSLGLVAASLLWLSLSSRLTAAGQRIVDMEARRRELGEAWISAVLRHGQATDPALLRQRAAALGFQPMPGAQPLWLSDPRALSSGPADTLDQALGTARRAAQAAVPPSDAPDVGGMLVDLGVAESASADMLQAEAAR